MGRVYEKWHICKCLVFHAENLVKVYTQKNSGYTKSRRKIRQQKIPKINSKFLHIEVLSREAWASKDTRFLTLSIANDYAFLLILYNYFSIKLSPVISCGFSNPIISNIVGAKSANLPSSIVPFLSSSKY